MTREVSLDLTLFLLREFLKGDVLQDRRRCIAAALTIPSMCRVEHKIKSA
jgi:hypothetical protein